MKRIIYFIPFVISALIILLYLTQVLSPYDEDGKLNLRNILIVEVLLFIFLATAGAIVLSLIDKLFFRKFYEPPKYKITIKHGIILAGIIILNIHLKIYDQFSILILVLTNLVLLGIMILDYSKTEEESNSDKKDSIEEENPLANKD